MTEIEAQNDVKQLNRLQSQMQWWRLGTTGLLVFGFIASIASIYGDVRGLTQPGPRQDTFSRELTTGLQQKTLPQIQTIATETLTQTRPQIEKEFHNVGQRLPEVTQFAVNELQTLQQNVTTSGEKAVEASLMPMLEKKEQKIRQMFPDATEENVHAVMTTLTEEGKQRAVLVADKLFARHTSALNNIVTSMETIRHSEKPALNDEQASWEMGLTALDIVRGELKAMEPKHDTADVPGPKTALNVTKSTDKEARL